MPSVQREREREREGPKKRMAKSNRKPDFAKDILDLSVFAWFEIERLLLCFLTRIERTSSKGALFMM